MPSVKQGLDLMERKPAALEELDPTDARDRGGVVEPKAAVRTRGRVKQRLTEPEPIPEMV